MAAKRRTEQVEETRAKLIGAARRAFAEKGYSAASMDELTAEAGLTRGALYHNFGDKKGLLQAVIDQIDAEILAQMRAAGQQFESKWHVFLAEAITYIEMSLEPEVQRIMLLDGPAVLGDPSQWPNQTACLRTTADMLDNLIAEGTVKPMDTEAAAHLINGAALNAALWIAASREPVAALPRAVDAFRVLMSGLLVNPSVAAH
ncbi:TetR/AcrR family transcriptional regulator [Pantoea sp. Acro-805]|uniref:TetR/AcrR family transcriptional regulator n=1 Tax=Candidatus Pantoea formicae TaxID=2608355 RepID=A0ABX0QR02_9GAMM|nr:TetR/AcrR family transcriptional regulator [Pantoea formicae]MDF7649550.1 TetR/AcrR family transcriptional regulator [Erwiniaceae bacterium L1_54_3]NIE99194.1 TetR/AcrR family transcriptional regulator [Pantoea formicae]